MAKQEPVQVEGVVLESLPSAMFKVKFGNEERGHELLCHISGKIRKNNIKIIPGDKVLVEMSPYDLTKGRIVFRNK